MRISGASATDFATEFMKTLHFLGAAILLSITGCNLAAPSPHTPSPTPTAELSPTNSPPTIAAADADILFTNGRVLTMDKAKPQAEAVALKGNQIVAVGTNAQIDTLRSDGTMVVDLDGRTLLPGFEDAHSHLFQQAADPLADQERAIEEGITSIGEFYVDQDVLNELMGLAEAGQLRMRVNAYLLDTTNCGDIVGDWWKAYRPNTEIAPHLYVRGIKIFADGGSCKVPAMSVEYPGGGMGDLFFTQDQLDRLVADVQAADFQVAIHALGDRAVEAAQNAISAALNGGPNIYRHRIEHNATIRPELLPRYGQIGIVPVIFGAYSTCIRTTGDPTKFKYVLSAEYGAWDWPWRALVDANPGLPIAWQGDYPIFGNGSPIYNMWGMVTREQVNTDGSICQPPDWLKAGALRIEEVLPMMTINSAYASFSDDQLGSIQPGKLADLVILSDDPLNMESEKLKDIRVLMTMIDGKMEYCEPGSESLCPSARSGPASGSETPSAQYTATASASGPDEPPPNAIDADLETAWNSGGDPEQWIQIDLGGPMTVSAIKLVVAQTPEGATSHQIWAGADPNTLALVHQFDGTTKDGDTLEFQPTSPLSNIRYVKILTTESPSWVAWREIEVVTK
jgi:predicted amidohydrolase YtcJ